MKRCLSLCLLLWAAFSLHAHALSAGVIGGADGPTAVFVAAGNGWLLALIAAAAIFAAVFFVFFIRRHR